MKNFEKYGRELKKYRGGMFCDDYVKPDVLKLKKDDECDHDCIRCLVLQMIWLLEDYEEPKEPEIDWSNVEVDTPILVKNSEDEMWRKRHFAKYKNGNVYAWSNGFTSWTENYMASWKYAKLAEDKENPEIDWSKVEVDTPILVRQGKNGRWLERHFAKYENGDVYAWVDGQTSWTGEDEIKWKYAKLAENEE